MTRTRVWLPLCVLAGLLVWIQLVDPARRRVWRMAIALISAATCFAVFWISAGETWTQFRDGVLEIKMPVPPTTKGRRLEITEAGKK